MRQAFLAFAPRHAALRALNYEPTIERIRTARGRAHVRLSDLVEDLGAGYATVFARVDCDAEHGIELLSQSDMFLAQPQGRIIRRDSMQHPERHEVRRWHVLIAGAGTLAPTELYGRAIIADGRLTGRYVGQDTLILGLRDPAGDFALFTYAYLASPTGLRALRSASYGTKILRIRRDILADLPVPRPDDAIVARVAQLVRSCVEHRERYVAELEAARAELEAETAMRAASALCGVRRAHSVMWEGDLPTLRGWTYASSGGTLGFLKKEWSGRLGDALQEGGAFHGGLRQRTPCTPPHGVPLYSQRDVFCTRCTNPVLPASRG